jgi:predicted PurR-regulated permease PerM
VILFVLVVGGAIFGILGIILSVPVTATAVRLTRYFFGRASGEPPGLRGDEPGPDPVDEPAAGTAVTSS